MLDARATTVDVWREIRHGRHDQAGARGAARDPAAARDAAARRLAEEGGRLRALLAKTRNSSLIRLAALNEN